jgi:hypothetical protein
MNKLKLIYVLIPALFLLACDDFLDETPDNRTELDSKIKIRKLLTSAYPSNTYTLLTELSSDNIADLGESNPLSTRMSEQVSYWQNDTESDSDGVKELWQSAYNAIAHANQALDAISKVTDEDVSAEKGEALITRAYNHFVLVNVFCKHYNQTSSSTDLGIPYIEAPETALSPVYQRGNVAEVYKKINADIEAALPLINDDIYEIKPYHFNKKAAYAFAARFNLYYEKWAKAKEYANVVLGNNPASVLRDWEALGLVTRDSDAVAQAYIKSNANLLSITAYTSTGLFFGGGYYYGSRFNHTGFISDKETLYADMPWGKLNLWSYNYMVFSYVASNVDKSLVIKTPFLFEVTDPVSNIGYYRSVINPFTADECLLVRAEAEIMLNEKAAAMDDLNTWTQAYFKQTYVSQVTTIADIAKFYDTANMPYSTNNAPNQKKKLNPKFSISAGEQESMIHYLLQCRRILTLHEGLRWFDIKRYGIEVPRYQKQPNGSYQVMDVLAVDDKRRAIQLPQDVISAGMEANPR